jgi:predicted transcriptional regulator
MTSLNWWILGIEMVLLLIILYIIFRLLPILQKRGREIRETEMVIRSLLDDIKMRIEGRDSKIAELMVRVEVLEDRYKNLIESKVKQSITEVTERTGVEETFQKVGKGVQRIVKPGDVIMTILKALDEKPHTSSEIQKLIGKSREHTARLLKSLYEKGLVVREEDKKPFIYMISETGREFLRSIG